MNILVGDTGFVGSFLSKQIDFSFSFNSKNIHEFSCVSNGCNIYLACLSAKKWLVNQNTQDDLKNMFNIIDVLKNRIYENIYLISTIDVYCESPMGVNEDYIPKFSKISYGSNRYLFELMVKQYLVFKKIKIFRLPSLFGQGLKKNVLFDLLNKNELEKINFNSVFQWYDLSDLKYHLNKEYNQEIVNLFTEPIETYFLCKHLFNIDVNLNQNKIEYNYKTKISEIGYIESKQSVLQKLRKFKNEYFCEQFIMDTK